MNGPGLSSSDAHRQSELQKVRAELAALKKRFRSIIQRTADGIVVLDEPGRIRFANQAAGRLFGRDAADLVGSPFGHAVVTGETTEIDIVRSGEPRVAELRVMETEWEGEPARIVTLRDITDRKQAEERERRLIRERVARAEAEEAARRGAFLAEAGRRLSSSLDLHATLQDSALLVIEGLADVCAVDLVDGDRTLRISASRHGDATGGSVREAREQGLDADGASPRAAVYREREARLVTPVTRAWLERAAADSSQAELLRSLEDGSLILAPLYAGRDCVGVLTAGRARGTPPFETADLHLFEELGQRIALAIENARLYRTAEAANRAKTNFLSVMSHELRTPLSAIMGYADLVDRGVAGEPTEKQKDFLGRIRASSNHLLQIIEEILVFASSESGDEEAHLEETTLGEIVDAVVTLAEPLARGSRLEFRREIDQPDAPLVTDPQKVRQILLNLLSNAFKFTREGSVTLRARVAGGRATFQVEDTGIGIAQDRLDEIFERFWQVEDPMTRRAGGTGLGLTIARSFARILDGSISVESVEGDGSVFTLELPRNPSA